MFSVGSYATVWETRPVKNAEGNEYAIEARISTSRKNKKTEQYETDFNQWVRFVGNAYDVMKNIVPGNTSRVKIGSCGSKTEYNKEKERTYYSFLVFDCENVSRENKEKEDAVNQQIPNDALPF